MSTTDDRVEPETFSPRHLRFGIMLAPLHDVAGDTRLQIQRNLEIVELVDRLGFAEAWCGSHMSIGHEIIGAPEVFLAAASQRTSRIRLGTGVSSLPYHHPFTLANRILDLDYVSGGRAMMGFGPGQLISDAVMMGLDQMESRDRMMESAEVVVALLRGETVTHETSWFKLDHARLQLEPCNPDGIEFAVASVFTPSGSTLAGRLGLGLLSIAASDIKGMRSLDAHWSNLQRHAATNGHVIPRSRWRVVGAMHLAETREQARAEARTRILPEMISFMKAVTPEETWEPWMDDPEAALDQWTTEGIGMFGGVATVGTPDDAVATIRNLIDTTGGFGCYTLYSVNVAPWGATKRSLELFAEYVVPEVRRTNDRRREAAQWYHRNAADFVRNMFAANAKATEKYGEIPAAGADGGEPGPAAIPT